VGLYTRGQWPTNDVFQNAYVIALFVSFGTKSLAGGEGDGPVWIPPPRPRPKGQILLILPTKLENEEFQNFNLLICFKCIFPLYSNISNPINSPFKWVFPKIK
jgi:hypothetical protein